VGSFDRVVGKRLRRQENARASAEGVIHWIDVVEFCFLLY
jgi:hypothetical protein